MGKQQQAGKQAAKQKSPKDVIKELEERMFGEKNKTKKKEIQGMIKKFELELELEKKKKQELESAKKNTVVKQLIPVGTDPKTVQCINFLNNNCDKGENCQFGHFTKKEGKRDASTIQETQKPKAICKFLIDAMNSGEYSRTWTCPLPKCNDIHRLIELSENSGVEVTLEEYIDLQRQTLDEACLTPVNEKTFAEWKDKKLREEELHARRVVALANSTKGADLFKNNPEMFEDDDEAGDEINYTERNYEELEEEDTQRNLTED